MAELHLPGHGWLLRDREKVPLHLCMTPISSSAVFLDAKENKKAVGQLEQQLEEILVLEGKREIKGQW